MQVEFLIKQTYLTDFSDSKKINSLTISSAVELAEYANSKMRLHKAN